MSPRPRVVSDTEILTGAARAIGRLGPAKLTLLDVAKEVGMSPAALVQRFGSKRKLLLSLAARGPEANRSLFEEIRLAHRSPYRRLLAMADCMAAHGSTPEEISNGLAFLQIDLIDPQFHRFALSSSEQIHEGIRSLVMEAVQARELIGCNAARLAHALQAAMNGSLLNWAIHRTGSLRAWIRRDLETLLRPYRPSSRRPRRKGTRPRPWSR